MGNHIIKNCEVCEKSLRIPADIGGMLMQCPGCGHKFHTDFKLRVKVREDRCEKPPARKKSAKRPSSRFRIIV